LCCQEELAAVNLAKYRKIQHSLEEAEARAEAAENAMSKVRTTGRNSVSASRVINDNLNPLSVLFLSSCICFYVHDFCLAT